MQKKNRRNTFSLPFPLAYVVVKVIAVVATVVGVSGGLRTLYLNARLSSEHSHSKKQTHCTHAIATLLAELEGFPSKLSSVWSTEHVWIYQQSETVISESSSLGETREIRFYISFQLGKHVLGKTHAGRKVLRASAQISFALFSLLQLKCAWAPTTLPTHWTLRMNGSASHECCNLNGFIHLLKHFVVKHQIDVDYCLFLTTHCLNIR